MARDVSDGDTDPLNDPRFQSVLEQLADFRFRKIVVFLGAGVSTAAGIADYRSRSGRWMVDGSMDKFTLSYCRQDPIPVYDSMDEFIGRNYQPTKAHRFLRLLQDKGVLRRVYTQNIDSLELAGGLDPALLVQCHGSFRTCNCCWCYRYEQPIEWLVAEIQKHPGQPIYCRRCKGVSSAVMKPSIVLFGEEMPSAFKRHLWFDMRSTHDHCDLVLIMGSTLAVSPFNQIVDSVPRSVERIYLNMERCERLDRSNDIQLLADIDTTVQAICDRLFWIIPPLLTGHVHKTCLSDLPEELLCLVLEAAASDLSDVGRLELVCKHFKAVVQPLWHTMWTRLCGFAPNTALGPVRLQLRQLCSPERFALWVQTKKLFPKNRAVFLYVLKSRHGLLISFPSIAVHLAPSGHLTLHRATDVSSWRFPHALTASTVQIQGNELLTDHQLQILAERSTYYAEFSATTVLPYHNFVLCVVDECLTLLCGGKAVVTWCNHPYVPWIRVRCADGQYFDMYPWTAIDTIDLWNCSDGVGRACPTN
eukprot:TRINITY_DN11471_c0_g1_i2.p1 TRINITY_DN11471_c0_g1~~TRINITY_DN11471_c0_g1_i2.p1  ORF type:complete len:532 (+),score=77.01 TRINITY_DN11471_c0_g1_i2:46-1641(+)